jgi:hypothetical protein
MDQAAFDRASGHEKQSKPATHMCIKKSPCPRRAIGCGGYIKMSSRKKSQLTGGHFSRGAHKNDNTKQSTGVRAMVGGASQAIANFTRMRCFWSPEAHLATPRL